MPCHAIRQHSAVQQVGGMGYSIIIMYSIVYNTTVVLPITCTLYTSSNVLCWHALKVALYIYIYIITKFAVQ